MIRSISLILILLFAVPATFAGTDQAAVTLVNASATLSQTSNTTWKLQKTGAIDPVSQTVTWTITATQGPTVGGRLVVYGFLTATNTGSKEAAIGNIVVNLQTKSGSNWVTQSSDIADASHGDGATTASIDPHASSENKSSFTENSASGKLEFSDATNNTIFSITPQKTIVPGSSMNLLFSAGFDNNILRLATGTAVRAEVIVTFGNSSFVPPSAANLDINGNGTIDPDEAWVRSLPARLGLIVPAEVAGNQAVTLSEAAQDIAATGTVTLSNAVFSLGATTGTVTVNYDGGASGGQLTSCAHLASASLTVIVGSVQFPNVIGIDALACDTQTVAPGGAGWKTGDMITYTQDEWGGDPMSDPAAALLVSNYDTVFASTFGVFEVGIRGASGFSMEFLAPTFVLAYLPASGPSGALTADEFDPSSSSSGTFGGDVVALKLNADFSDAGAIIGASRLKFGDLRLCNLTTLPALNGATVRQFFTLVNTLLGGGTGVYTIGDVEGLLSALDAAFPSGSPSIFAQQNLFPGACPAGH